MWDLKKKKEIGILGKHLTGVKSLIVCPKKNFLISAGSIIKIWDLKTKKFLNVLGKTNLYINSLFLSSDSNFLYSSVGKKIKKILKWDLNENKEIGLLEGVNNHINCICISKNGKILFSGGEDGTITMWDLLLKKKIGILGKHEKKIISLTLLRKKNILFSSDGIIKIWSIGSKTEIKEKTGEKGEFFSYICPIENKDYFFTVGTFITKWIIDKNKNIKKIKKCKNIKIL